jgi:hypothetical protein
MRKKLTKREIVILLITLLFVIGIKVYATKFKFYCTNPPLCPWEAYCTGHYATHPSTCKVQCWSEEWGPGGSKWLVKSGSATCGEDSDGKPPIWPEL